MKNFKILLVTLVAMIGLNSCSEDCDHDVIDVDYSKSILGTWSSESETYEEGIRFNDDGKFSAFGNKGEGDFYVDGTWVLKQNRLVLTTNEGKTHFSGSIEVYAEDVMLMTADGSKDTHVYHYYVDQPLPKSLVGTWSCLDADFAEVLTIQEDGSLVSTRLENGDFWEGKTGTFDGEEGSYMINLNNDYYFGYYEVVSGELLVLVDPRTNDRRTYRYCKEDLADEIMGMWVYNDVKSDMRIHTFEENGSATFTGWSNYLDEFSVLENSGYKVIGDLLFQYFSNDEENSTPYIVARLMYVPNGNALGDMMYISTYSLNEESNTETTTSWLRIKQSLDLPGKAYNYSATYISNAKGQDKDIAFLDTKFNFAKMDGSIIDKFLKSVLYAVEFPDAETFQYNCLLEGQNVSLQLPIEVEGNKMTIKMSSRHEAYHDVVVYAFQDADCSQFHMYMPTSTFENFFSNMSLSILSASGQVDINNPVHVDAVYKEVADAIESINVSIVMKNVK